MTSPESPTPPPAWYPDPQNPSVQRWWDGGQWTEYQRPAAAASYGLPPAGGPMSAQDERNWLLAAHLSALPAAFLFLAFLGPLLVFLFKGGDSPLVRQHAVAALNFHLSWMIWGALLVGAMIVLSFILVGLLLIPVIVIGAVAWFVIVVMASVRAGNGDLVPFAYPLTINFVK